jgi:hypothetical protein
VKRTTASKVRTALVLTLGAVSAGGPVAGTAWADAPDGGMETTHGPSVVTIDNSNADSWLEVDRTGNVLGPFSHGTAGSDHDGGGGAIEQNVTGSPGTGLQAAPDEDGIEDDEDDESAAVPPAAAPTPPEESAASGGDDDEGDADHDATPAPGPAGSEEPAA